MKSLFLLTALCLCSVAWSQKRYYKRADGTILTERAYEKIFEKQLAQAVENNKEGVKLEISDKLTLLRKTRDSIVFAYEIEFRKTMEIKDE